MKKSVLAGLISILMVMSVFAFSGCSSTNPSETDYWFSKNSSDFEKYEENKNNLSTAGTYWYFTAAKDIETVMSVKLNVDNIYSAAYLYVNDAQVKSENNTGIYTYVYKLSLKKGDSLKLHAFWTNSLTADDTGFEISMLSMTEGSSTYLLSEFDKTTAA